MMINSMMLKMWKGVTWNSYLMINNENGVLANSDSIAYLWAQAYEYIVHKREVSVKNIRELCFSQNSKLLYLYAE